MDWGSFYRAPIGVNENYSSQFEYTAFVIQAAEDDTVVTVTGASTASAQCSAGSLTALDQGQSCLVPGVNLGASVTAAGGKPVQVHLLTGDVNSSYEYDAFTLVPRSKWGPSYYSPVGTTASFPAQIIIYNPGQGASGTGQLDVRCVFGNGTGINRNNIAANDTASVEVPANYGARCYAKNGDSDGAAFLPTAQFFAISVVDSAYEGTGGGESYDWGFTLIPDELLSPQALVGLGLGQDPTKPLTDNGSPVWVTAVCPTGVTAAYIYADVNGDGVADLVDLNGDLDSNDGSEPTSNNGILVSPLQSLRIFNPGTNPYRNQTGMRVWSLSGANGNGTPQCSLAVAWGEDPSSITAGSPGFDVGTTVRSLKSFTVNKSVSLASDNDGNGAITPGDVVTYTIEVKNTGLAPISGVVVSDTLPAQAVYVANSTRYSAPSGSGTIADAGASAFPLDEGGWSFSGTLQGIRFSPPTPGQTLKVVFRAAIVNAQCGDVIVNTGYATALGTTLNDEERTRLTCPSTIEIIKQAFGGDGSTVFNFAMASDDPAFADAYESFSLTPPADSSTSFVARPLLPTYAYTVTEASPLPAGWAFERVTCVQSDAGTSSWDIAGNRVVIDLGQNSKVTCTYVNFRPQVRIRVTPDTAVNAVNTPHTFTAFVEGSKDGGSTWTGIQGVTVAWGESGPAAPDTGSCITNGSGSCPFQITSATAGLSTVTATAPSVSYQGTTFTNVTSNGSAQNSGPGEKTWVDLRIRIDPPTADNPLGLAHTFTVSVTQDLGNGLWVPVSDGTRPAVDISPQPAGFALVGDSCAGAGTVSGACTVVINSSVAQLYTANASVTATVVGQSISRSTQNDLANSAAGGSGPATKRYLEGNVTISKTVDESYTRTFTWTIEKTVSPEEIYIFDGDRASATYAVSVTKDAGNDTDYAIAGQVTFANTSSYPVILQAPVDRLANGIEISLQCGVTFPYTLNPGASFVCNYSQLLSRGLDTTNLVTVTSTSGTTFTGSAPVDFGDPTTVVNDS
ncbi:MAG: DUF11 domain-containing protein, partial [Caldilinea sp.]|nr:DUF11 domain-containing protein [Caldilinea sp.]